MYKKKLLYLFAVLLIITISACLICSFLSAESSTTDLNEQKTDISETEATETGNLFLDVRESDWFFDDVKYVAEKQLMNGTGDMYFSPNETTRRGMLVTILWRLAGSPDEGETDFLDVQKDAYYFDAVNWAYANGIVNGYNETYFGPEDDITREQLATIIYKYAVYKKHDVSGEKSLDEYGDINLISDYAISALEWANANEIITGTPENLLMPQGFALRCQVAAILRRFCSQLVSAKRESIVQSELKSNSNSTHQTKEAVSAKTNETIDEEQTENSVITLNSVSVAPGNNAQLLLKVKNNPGILGMTLTVHYDDANLWLESVENGEAFGDVLDLTTSKSLASGVRFAWDGLEIASDEIRDGTILYMNFNVPHKAKAGRYPITITYTDGDIVDSTLTNVSLPIEKGYITIID